MSNQKIEQQRPAPRLVKATELATRKAQRDEESTQRREREKNRIAEILKAAANGRGQRDARAVFDALFQNPSPA